MEVLKGAFFSQPYVTPLRSSPAEEQMMKNRHFENIHFEQEPLNSACGFTTQLIAELGMQRNATEGKCVCDY